LGKVSLEALALAISDVAVGGLLYISLCMSYLLSTFLMTYLVASLPSLASITLKLYLVVDFSSVGGSTPN
jgi:hypothetical protein